MMNRRKILDVLLLAFWIHPLKPDNDKHILHCIEQNNITSDPSPQVQASIPKNEGSQGEGSEGI